ncbi:phage tail protein [Escherichia coli]|nr:phage tail protein [Escherichia coli]
MIWQPEFTDKILSRKPGAVHSVITDIPDLIITEYMFPLKGE